MSMFSFLSKKKDEKPSRIGFLYSISDKGTLGIFNDYPNVENVLLKVQEEITFFFPEVEREIFSSRDKRHVGIDASNLTISFFIKGKFMNRSMKDLSQSKYLKAPLLSGGLGRISEQQRHFSVLNELLCNRVASKRYKEKFNSNLPIEVPVGFFISAREEDKGARWVIFEDLNEIEIERKGFLNSSDLEYDFQKQFSDILPQIGIQNNTSFKRLVDAVPTGDPSKPKFFIVDSEEWEILNRIK